MENYNEKELIEAIENIKELKSLINNKQKLFRPVILSKDFVNMLFYATLFMFITTIIIAIGYSKYSTFWNFPILYKAIIILSLVLNFIIISVKKINTINKSPDLDIPTGFGIIYSFHLIILLILGILFSVIFATITNLTWVYLPVLTILYGLLIIYVSEPIGVIEFRYMGYFTIIIAIVSMLFLQIPLLLLGFSMYTLIFFSYFILLSFVRRTL